MRVWPCHHAVLCIASSTSCVHVCVVTRTINHKPKARFLNPSSPPRQTRRAAPKTSSASQSYQARICPSPCHSSETSIRIKTYPVTTSSSLPAATCLHKITVKVRLHDATIRCPAPSRPPSQRPEQAIAKLRWPDLCMSSRSHTSSHITSEESNEGSTFGTRHVLAGMSFKRNTAQVGPRLLFVLFCLG